MNLYEFQKDSARWLLEHKRAILGSEMGTGKTAVAIKAAKYLLDKGHLKRVYIVVPASLKLNWDREIFLWTGSQDVQIFSNKKDKILSDYRWVVFSYEIFQAVCLDLPPCDLLILDESHRVKSKDAKRTKVILGEFAPKVPWVWFLTGTPMPNSIIDAYTTFNFCSYGRFGSYWNFAARYCYIQATRFGKKVHGGKNLDELASCAEAFMRRDTVAEHLAELPDEQVINIPLAHTKQSTKYIASNAELSVVNKLIDGVGLDEDEKEISEVMASRRRELSELKVKQTIEFVKDLLESSEPVILFAHHRSSIMGLLDGLKGYRVSSIYGDTPSADRQKAVDDFQAGNLDCLVISIQAGGVGLTLTRAKVSVFHELPWVPADFEQAKARIRRIGQKQMCTHYVLNYPLTIDDAVMTSLQRKSRVINKFYEERA